MRCLIALISIFLLASCNQTKSVLAENEGITNIQETVLINDLRTFGNQHYQNIIEQKFDLVEAAFQPCFSNNNPGFEIEIACSESFNIFNRFDESFLKKLQRWGEQKANSYLVKMALGNYYENAAWLIRGHGYSSETSRRHYNQYQIVLKKAVDKYREAVDLNPNLPFGYFSLVTTVGSLSSEDAQEIEKIFAIGIKNNPKSFIIRDAMIGRKVPRWGGSYEKMEKIFQTATPYFSSAPFLEKLRYRIVTGKGWDYLSGYGDIPFDLKKARILFEEAHKIFPSNRTIFLLAKSYLCCGEIKLEEGRNYLENTINNNPYKEFFMYSVIDLYNGLEDKKGKLNLLKWMAAINPDSFRMQMRLGNFYLNNNQDDLAKSAYQKVIRVNPFDIISFRNIQKIEQKNGKKVKYYWSNIEYLTKYLANIFPREEVLNQLFNQLYENLIKQDQQWDKIRLKKSIYGLITAAELENELLEKLPLLNLSLNELRSLTTKYADFNRSCNYLKKSYIEDTQKFFKTDAGAALQNKVFEIIYQIYNTYLDQRFSASYGA